MSATDGPIPPVNQPGAKTGPQHHPASGKAPPPIVAVTQVSRPFFTSSELKYLLQQTIPESKKVLYSQKKHQVFQFIFQLIKNVKFPLRVLATTMNYYQRYFLFNKWEESTSSGTNGTADTPTSVQEAHELIIKQHERDPFVIAMSCLLLASKNEDCIKKLKDIQVVGNKLRDIDDQDSKGLYLDFQRKAILNIEFKILQVIKFDFLNGSTMNTSVDQLLVQFCKKLGIDYIHTMYSWLVCFDIMSTPLCLMIPSHCIAVAIIIITLNVKPKDIAHKFNRGEQQLSSHDLNVILENLDCYSQFRCPETLVNEGIIYVLDYYVHNMNYLILNEYMPAIDADTGKEQIFKFMDLKSRFNDLKILDEASCSERDMLRQDYYLKPWDYGLSAKGCSRFMLGNKRGRFELELQFEQEFKKKKVSEVSNV